MGGGWLIWACLGWGWLQRGNVAAWRRTPGRLPFPALALFLTPPTGGPPSLPPCSEKKAEAKRKGRKLGSDESDSDYDEPADGSGACGTLLELLGLLPGVQIVERCGCCGLRALRRACTHLVRAPGPLFALLNPSACPRCLRRAGSDEELPTGVADDPFFQQEADPFDDPFFQAGCSSNACSVLHCVLWKHQRCRGCAIGSGARSQRGERGGAHGMCMLCLSTRLQASSDCLSSPAPPYVNTLHRSGAQPLCELHPL